MRCRACDTVWLVSGPSSASAVAVSDDTAPRAAVQRRGAERERRDLFASRPVDDGIVRETMRPPPYSAPPPSGLAGRSENSVLFKVSDVMGAAGTARVKTPEPSASPAPLFHTSTAPSSVAPRRDGKEDSGIIDLKALSTAPPAPNRAPAPMLFGSPSEPPPAFARDVAASSSSYPQANAPKSKLRTVGMVFAGFAVVAACGVGVALAFGAANPPPKAAAAFVPPPPPAPPPAVAPPAPEPTSTTTTTSASTDDAKDSKDAKSKGKRKGKGGAAKSSAKAGLITNTSAPPPPPKPVKPADPCGCHGDFNCILACTAGKK
jgi:hypothetical protein